MPKNGTVPLVAGVDVGTTRTKAVLCTATGEPVARAEVSTPRDARGVESAVLDVLRECVTAAGRSPSAIGVTSMAETGVPLDRDLQPIGELLSWQDPRGAMHADKLRAEFGDVEFFRRTGLRLSAKLPLAKWRWLHEENAGALRSMSVWAGAAELAVLALAGKLCTDATLAGRTGAYDIVASQYVPEFSESAGVAAAQLPRVVAAGEVAATVNQEAAARTGITSGTPVVVAGHDHLVAAYAAGVRHGGQVADSMGTAEAVVTVTDRPHLQPEIVAAGTSVGRFVDGEHFCLISGLPSSGALLDWFLDTVLRRCGTDRYKNLDADLLRMPNTPTGIVVEPYLSGRAAPAPDSHRRLHIAGLSMEHTASDIAKALIEGTCLHVRWMIDAQAAITERPPTEVFVLGGPSASAGWMRIKSAVISAALRVCEFADSAAAGAAFLAGRAVGAVSPDVSLPAKPVECSARDRAVWDEFYRTAFLPRVMSNTKTMSEERPSE